MLGPDDCYCQLCLRVINNNESDWRHLALQARDALKELLMHGCAVPDKDGNPIPYQADPEYAREVINAIDAQEVK